MGGEEQRVYALNAITAMNVLRLLPSHDDSLIGTLHLLPLLLLLVHAIL